MIQLKGLVAHKELFQLKYKLENCVTHHILVIMIMIVISDLV